MAGTAIRGCAQRVEGPSRPLDPRYDMRIGPIAFFGLKLSNRDRLPRASRRGTVTPFKILLEVRAGAPATVSIGGHGRGIAALVYRDHFLARYHSLSQGDTAVTFTPCPPSQPWRTAHRVVGPRTQFNGGFLLARAGCVPLIVRAGASREYQRTIRFGGVRGAC